MRVLPGLLLLSVWWLAAPVPANAAGITQDEVAALLRELDEANIRKDYRVLINRLSADARVRWVGTLGGNSIAYHYSKKSLIERLRRHEADRHKREGRLLRVERTDLEVQVSPDGQRAVVSSGFVMHGENDRGPATLNGRDELTVVRRQGKLWIIEYLFDTDLRY
jgi:hypothetical protein